MEETTTFRSCIGCFHYALHRGHVVVRVECCLFWSSAGAPSSLSTLCWVPVFLDSLCFAVLRSRKLIFSRAPHRSCLIIGGCICRWSIYFKHVHYKDVSVVSAHGSSWCFSLILCVVVPFRSYICQCLDLICEHHVYCYSAFRLKLNMGCHCWLSWLVFCEDLLFANVFGRIRKPPSKRMHHLQEFERQLEHCKPFCGWGPGLLESWRAS